MIEGVLLTKEKVIRHELGDIYHAMKSGSPGFSGFGEAYFSTVHSGVTKGWNRHERMVLNLLVPLGKIRFVLYDDRENSATTHQFMDVTLSTLNYLRLTIPPGIWIAFKGMDDGTSLLLNVASIGHDPAEMKKVPLDKISYSDWNKA